MNKIKATIIGSTLLVAVGASTVPTVPLTETHEQFVGATQVCKMKNGNIKETALTQEEYRAMALPDAEPLPQNCFAYEEAKYDTPSGTLETEYFLRKNGKFYKNGGEGKLLELDTVPRETVLEHLVN